MHALRLRKQVQPAGTIHLDQLPLDEGQLVEVLLLPLDDDMDDLGRASETGLAFWDNEIDDQVWNEAVSPT
jgi:hypothetical protein